MAYIGNSPQATTVLRLEARKSFALSVWIRDTHGRPLDISNTELHLVMKKPPLRSDPGDTANLITNAEAEIVGAVEGLARFNVQASDLDHTPGEYPFALVMITDGYSTVAAKGVVDLQENTEFASVNSTYLPANAPSAVVLNVGSSQITLSTGPTLAPGTTSFTDGDKEKLDGIEDGAQVNVEASWLAEEGMPGYIRHRPLFGSAAFSNIEDLLALPAGGFPGEVLVKLSNTDYMVGWQQPTGGGGGGGTLPATGVTAGYVPTANGVDGWGWAAIVSGVESVNGKGGAVTLTLNDLADTATRLAMTPAERSKLEELDTSISYDDLLDKPPLGTAAAQDAEAFLQPGGVAASDVTSGVLNPLRIPPISELEGFRAGTAAPSGGFDGEIYFQYS